MPPDEQKPIRRRRRKAKVEPKFCGVWRIHDGGLQIRAFCAHGTGACCAKGHLRGYTKGGNVINVEQSWTSSSGMSCLDFEKLLRVESKPQVAKLTGEQV